jgi:hypothetical protein
MSTCSTCRPRSNGRPDIGQDTAEPPPNQGNQNIFSIWTLKKYLLLSTSSPFPTVGRLVEEGEDLGGQVL